MGMSERRRKCRELMKRYYRDVPSREEILDGAISGVLGPSDVLVDAGCGVDVPLLAQYGPKASLAIGIDVCPPIVKVPSRSYVVVGNLESMPLGTSSVDLVISRSVMEHLDRPVSVFEEIRRILRPGGRLVFTTPNKFYYSCLIARLLPDRAKDAYFRNVFGEDGYDSFPVYYRANSVRAFRRLADAVGFEIEQLQPIRHYPYYLMFSPLLFRVGMLYDWLITELGLRWLQSNWLVVMRKR